MENNTNKKICPICGGENDCGAANTGEHDSCWCMTAKVPKKLLEKIPPQERGKACVCKNCVENFKSEEEVAWDARADRFNEYQQTNKSPIEDQVLSYLAECVLSQEFNVLDIGGGSGRYAIPLAKRSKEVVMTDFSANMLAHARNNASAEGVSNINFEKLDWSEADLKALGWEQAFDVVFASMCPALRTSEGLEKMIAASKKYCFINQFIVDKDSVGIFLDEHLEIERTFDPHNDRDSVERFFNELWKRGFDPQIRYAVDEYHKEMSFEEALSILEKDYGATAREKGKNIKDLLEEYRKNEGTNNIPVRGKTVSAMILWEIKE